MYQMLIVESITGNVLALEASLGTRERDRELVDDDPRKHRNST